MSAFADDVEALVDAASRHDRLAAWNAAGWLVAHLSGTPVAHDTVKSLVWNGATKERWFDIAELLAGAAADRSDAPSSTRRLHAQMLMERGFVEEALSRLDAILADPELPAYDRGQAFGHIGRIHKDRFVSAAESGDKRAAKASLRRAVAAYLAGRPQHAELAPWLGINAAALLSRPEAVAIEATPRETAQRLAREVQAEIAISVRKKDQYTDAAMAEVHLVLDDYPSALTFVERHAFDASVNGFALNTFHRQLSRVWRIGRGPSPGPEMLALLRAALLQKTGGAFLLSSRDLQAARKVDYQSVFGADRFDSLENYRRGLDRCSCVARIGRSADTGVGSGFVLPGKVLSDKLDPSFVLLTNAHVISEADDDRNRGALLPAEAVVTFAALRGVSPTKELRIAKVLYSSPPDELDVVVAKLDGGIAPKSEYPLSDVLPVAGVRSPVRVIGHPSGRGLSLSTNELLDHETPRLHYRAATEGGSSGSPVFNQEWKLIGIHHAGGDAVPRLNGGSGTYQANEGIWIKSIREAIHRGLA